MPEVRAAGAVVYIDGPKFAIIHRPHRGDWSLPKGKLDPGEDFETAAVREVREEIGVSGELGKALPTVRYKDHKGRSKEVRYWLMDAGRVGRFKANDEVDELRWLPAKKALDLLSYKTDRQTLKAALEAL
jgi:8-oxo-dGTP diphosphatase